MSSSGSSSEVDVRWGLVRSHLEKLLEMTEAERAAYIAARLGDRPDIRSEVEELLQAEAESELLEQSAEQRLPGLMAELAPRELENEPEEDPEIGSQIGPWVLQSVLGEGGMGRVYLAERQGDGFLQRAALKILRHHLDSPEALSRFSTERSVLARLAHPAIASLVDGGRTDDGRPYVVMEYVEGTALDRYCDTHRLPLSSRIRLICDICEAVELAHRRLVIHRDLKPSNVLVTPEGKVKLLDFGIAKVLDPSAESPNTVFSSPLTPAYSSPEQRFGGPVTTAVDVYSLGVMLWELLLGIRPPQGNGTQDVGFRALQPSRCLGDQASAGLADALAARATTRSALRRQLRGDLDAILTQAVAENPADRYSGPGALAADLERFLHGLPVVARRSSLSERLGKFARRNPVGFLASALAVFFLVVGGGGCLFLAHQATLERDHAQRQAARARGAMDLTRSLFAIPGRGNRGEQQLTLRQLLLRAEERLDADPKADPEMLLEVFAVLTDLYESSGLYPDAVRVAERAVRLAQDEIGDASVESGLALDRLGLTWIRAGEPNRGIQHLETALGVLEAKLGRAAPEVLEVLRHISYVAGVREYKETERLRRDILERERVRSAGQDTLGLAQALNDHARVLYFSGRGESALRQLDEAWHIRQRMGSTVGELAVILNNRAMVEASLGRGATAESTARKALELVSKDSDRPEALAARPWTRLARSLRIQGKHREALQAAERAVSLSRVHYAKSHPYATSARLIRGELLCDQDDYAAAERDFEAALVGIGLSYPDHSWKVGEVRVSLALCRIRQGGEAEARRMLQASRERIVAELGPETPIGRNAMLILNNENQ
ncbi:MAG: protein kinase [Acidobacteriota bacterium]